MIGDVVATRWETIREGMMKGMMDPADDWLQWHSPEWCKRLLEWTTERGIEMRESVVEYPNRARERKFVFVRVEDEVRYRKALIGYLQQCALGFRAQ